MEYLLDFLSDGKRMENPQNCPSEIYDIMQNCWLEDRYKRPEFAQISLSIGRILEQRASKVSPFQSSRIGWNTFRVYGKSTKFGTMIVYDIVNNIGYGERMKDGKF